jgi:hypothetical protein
MDPSIQNYIYQNRLKQELQERQFGAARTGDRNESAALQGLMGQADEMIAENPLTQQKAEVDAYRTRRQGAVEAGFGGEVDPIQAMGQYQRRMEEAKIRGPERVAQIGAAGDIAQQQEASRGALAVMESKGAQAQNFQDMMNQARMSGQNISGYTMPGGGGSVRYQQEREVPPGLLHDVTLARQAAQAAANKPLAGLSGDPRPEDVALQQAIQGAIIRHSAPADLKAFAQRFSKEPRTAQLPLDEILKMTGQDALSEVEKGHLQDLFAIYRGF